MDGLSVAASGVYTSGSIIVFTLFISVDQGLAIVQLTAYLTSGLIKLHDFWSTIRQAPDDIAYIVRDLRCLSSLLDDISSQQYHGPSLLKVMECCEAKIQVLMSIVQRLEPNFNSEIRRIRFWNKFKAARKKQVLKDFRDSLQETKLTLILALNSGYCLSPIRVRDFPVLRKNTSGDSEPLEIETPKVSLLGQGHSERELLSYSETMLTRRNSDQEPVLCSETKPILTRSLSELQFPKPYDNKMIGTSPVRSNAGDMTFESESTNPPTTSVSDIQALIQACVENALRPITGRAFEISDLTNAINNTIRQASVMRATGYDPDAISIREAFSSFTDTGGTPKANIPNSNNIVGIKHHVSVTETVFGTVWLRTSTAKVKSHSKHIRDHHHLVTSFVYYPAWWLTQLGLKHGIELGLSTSTKGWQFSLSPIRVVPDESLIFEFCKVGNVEAVCLLLNRGEASVLDTNSKGWMPLHFAAEAANVELCSYLISEGANESALAYEGPSENALSPITIFGETAQAVDAERKIAILRLFSNCLDPSDTSGEAWTVAGSLVRSHSKEKSSLTANSIFWLLRSFIGNTIRFEARTIWHGLQHAMRSFQLLSQEDLVWHKMQLLELGNKVRKSHALSISRWLGLQVAARHLLPLLLIAGAFLHIEGFDWVGNTPEPSPAIIDQQFPFIGKKWTDTLMDCIEEAETLTARELTVAMKQMGWDSMNPGTRTVDPDHEEAISMGKSYCSTCKDDYASLGIGLIEPRWIAFADCIKAKHQFRCACLDFPWRDYTAGRCASSQGDCIYRCQDKKEQQNSDDSSLLITSSTEKSQQASCVNPENHGNDVKTYSHTKTQDCTTKPDGISNNPSEIVLLEEVDEQTVIQALDDTNQRNCFQAAAHQLYRSQGRTWTGIYEVGECLCGSCFLWREGYGDGEDNFFSRMPMWFRAKAEQR